MKKRYLYILIVTIIFSYLVLPVSASAKTLKQFEDEMNTYINALQAKKNQVAKNEAEIAEIKRNISTLQNKVNEAEKEIENLQVEIDDSNKKIEKKGQESKKIIEYHQISNGENSYLEYIFGAKTIKDMIYRVSMVEQLTEYNDKVMKELDALIKKNEKQQVQLNNKKTELGELEKQLNSEKAKIEAENIAIRAGMPSDEEQIKLAQANIKYYKSLGCGINEDVQSCQYRVEQSRGGSSGGFGSVPSTNGFFRPVEYGRINQAFNRGHMGMDIGSSNRTIEIHPIAAGVVTAVYWDSCSSSNCSVGCNGRARVVKVKHNYNGRYLYSTYAHLSSFNVGVGQTVTADSVLGNMGTTGCSTGNHLHLEINDCDWKSPGGGCSWNTYAATVKNPANYVNFPASWTNR